MKTITQLFVSLGFPCDFFVYPSLLPLKKKNYRIGYNQTDFFEILITLVGMSLDTVSAKSIRTVKIFIKKALFVLQNREYSDLQQK